MAKRKIAEPKPKIPKRKTWSKRPPGAKFRGGRPATKLPPTEEAIFRMAEIDCTYQEISAVLGITVTALSKSYSDIIKAGREHGKQSLKRAQFKTALKGNPQMLIWLGKQRLGQRDKVDNSHSIVDPIKAMSQEELEREIKHLEQFKLPEPESKKDAKLIEGAEDADHDIPEGEVIDVLAEPVPQDDES